MDLLNRIKRSHLLKTILFFLLVWLVLIVLLTIFSNSSTKMFYEKIKATYENQLDFIVKDLENSIEQISSSQNTFVYDDSVVQLALNYGNLEKSQALFYAEDVFSKMNLFITQNKYVESAYLYLLNWNRCLVSDGNLIYCDTKRAYNDFLDITTDSVLAFSDNAIYSCPNYVYYGTKNCDLIMVIKFSEAEVAKIINRDPTESGGRFAYATSTGKKIGSTFGVTINDKEYVVFKKSSEKLNITICEYMPRNSIMLEMEAFRNSIILIMIALVVSLLVLLLYIYKVTYVPLKKLANAFERVSNEQFDFSIAYNGNDEYSSIYNSFNYMLDKIRHLIDDVYKQKLLISEAEYSQLQSKVAPHFLYNNLFVIKTMANLGDTEGIEKLTDYLGEFYRYICSDNGGTSTLYDELSHAKTYTEIRKILNVKNLEVEFDEILEEFSNIEMPRLIIQPIIENCFKYAFKNQRKKNFMSLHWDMDDFVTITIEDNGDISDEDIVRISSEVKSSKLTGLAGINSQLIINFNSGLAISRASAGGLRVTMKIPVKGE